MTNKYLINNEDQIVIAGLIDKAVTDVISELSNHGSEEGVTPSYDYFWCMTMEKKAV